MTSSSTTGRSCRHPPVWIEVAPGLSYIELRRSDGQVVEEGDSISVHYTVAVGRVAEGEAAWLDNSWNRTEPFRFTVGAGEVLLGIDKCIAGIRVSGERRIIMNSDWAFGDRGLPGLVDPGSPLTLKVYMVTIEQKWK